LRFLLPPKKNFDDARQSLEARKLDAESEQEDNTDLCQHRNSFSIRDKASCARAQMFRRPQSTIRPHGYQLHPLMRGNNATANQSAQRGESNTWRNDLKFVIHSL